MVPARVVKSELLAQPQVGVTYTRHCAQQNPSSVTNRSVMCLCLTGISPMICMPAAVGIAGDVSLWKRPSGLCRQQQQAAAVAAGTTRRSIRRRRAAARNTKRTKRRAAAAENTARATGIGLAVAVTAAAAVVTAAALSAKKQCWAVWIDTYSKQETAVWAVPLLICCRLSALLLQQQSVSVAAAAVQRSRQPPCNNHSTNRGSKTTVHGQLCTNSTTQLRLLLANMYMCLGNAV